MRRSGAILLVVLLLGLAAAAWLLSDDENEPAAALIEHGTTADAPPPPMLRGRPPSSTAPTVHREAPESEGDPEEAVMAPIVGGHRMSEIDFASLQQSGGPGDKAPVYPKRPEYPNQDLGDPSRKIRLQRLELLGRPVTGFGPWLPDGAESMWSGVVGVERGDAVATADAEIDEPLVTAVTGRIQSGEDPLPGAEVILYSTFYQRHARYDHHVREVGRTWTDAEGVFDLRPVGLDTVHFGSDGELLLTVHRPGFGSLVARRLDNIQPEVENDLGTFDLQSVSPTLSGVIRDLEGTPVAGACVRMSGSVNPVLYDKTERMIILKDCPCAVTDGEGRYILEGFAADRQHVSIHVNIDCVQHIDTTYTPGEHTWSPRVLAGNSVLGRVIDGNGDPVAAAVVRGGGNWTPSNADGTFWLDNINAGPFQLEVAHHLFSSVRIEGVVAGTEDLEVVMAVPLPRVVLQVAAKDTGEALNLITIDWTWNGGPPHQFVPVSRFWHAKDGRYEIVVPEGAIGATVSAAGYALHALTAENLVDGAETPIVLPTAAE